MTTLCNLSQYRKPAPAGFTLTEMLITISIVAILLAIATPSFSSIIANQRAKAAASELYATLSFARSAAITRNANVRVNPKSPSWQSGWQVVDGSNTVLDDRGTTTGITISGSLAAVTYTPSGRMVAGATPQFVFTPNVGTTAQCVSISLSGRPYIKAATSC